MHRLFFTAMSLVLLTAFSAERHLSAAPGVTPGSGVANPGEPDRQPPRRATYRASAAAELAGREPAELRRFLRERAQRRALGVALKELADKSQHPHAQYAARILVGLGRAVISRVAVLEDSEAVGMRRIVVEIQIDRVALGAAFRSRLAQLDGSADPLGGPESVWVHFSMGVAHPRGDYNRLVQAAPINRLYHVRNMLASHQERRALGAVGLWNYERPLSSGPLRSERLSLEVRNGRLGFGASLQRHRIAIHDSALVQFGNSGRGDIQGNEFIFEICANGRCALPGLTQPPGPLDHAFLVRGRQITVDARVIQGDLQYYFWDRPGSLAAYGKLSIGFLGSRQQRTLLVHLGVNYPMSPQSRTQGFAEIHMGSYGFDRSFGGRQFVDAAGIYFGVRAGLAGP